jgi:hypothetical protein
MAVPPTGDQRQEAGPTATMMAGITGHVWSFDELFKAILKPASQP